MYYLRILNHHHSNHIQENFLHKQQPVHYDHDDDDDNNSGSDDHNNNNNNNYYDDDDDDDDDDGSYNENGTFILIHLHIYALGTLPVVYGNCSEIYEIPFQICLLLQLQHCVDLVIFQCLYNVRNLE